MSGCSSHGTTSQCNADKKCVWAHRHHHCVPSGGGKGAPVNWKMIGIVLGSIAGAALVAFLIWFLVQKYGQ